MAKEREEKERREKSLAGKGGPPLRVSVSFKGKESEGALATRGQDSSRRGEVFYSARSRFETPDQERACLHRVFTVFDENCDGKLSVLEIHCSLAKLGIYLPLHDLRSAIASALYQRGALRKEDDSPLPMEFHTPRGPREDDNLIPVLSHTTLDLPKEVRTTLSNTEDDATLDLPKEVHTALPNVEDDATLDFAGFRQLYRSLSSDESLLTPSTLRREEEADLRAAFGVFDKDKDGFITADELQLVLHNLGFQEGRDLSKCKELIDRVDVDKDGRVSFAEFRVMVDEFHNPHRT